MDLLTIKGGLKKGFSTGAVSTAAIKASIRYYFLKNNFNLIEIEMPGGEIRPIGVFSLSFKTFKEGGVAACSVIEKYSGDDPDVTGGIKINADFIDIDSIGAGRIENKEKIDNGLKTILCDDSLINIREIYKKITIYNHIYDNNNNIRLLLATGVGIGIVKKPGLPVNIGCPAINPIPFKMINYSVSKELFYWVNLMGFTNKIFLSVLYIPDGEEVAKKTLNTRLGIEGGLSILGTTGYVIPISAFSWLETIKSSLKFLSANNITTCIFTPGRFSEKKALKIFHEYSLDYFIEIGDFISYSMRKAGQFGIKEVIFVGQFGKILKISQGSRNTNAKYSTLNLNYLGDIVKKRTSDIELYKKVINSNTSREAFMHIIDKINDKDNDKDKDNDRSIIIIYDVLKNAKFNLERMSGGLVKCRVILLSYEGEKIFDV
jgi:cobalt-precorrin-5B (C1)-methyltransferase